jgi:hypothetical protein
LKDPSTADKNRRPRNKRRRQLKRKHARKSKTALKIELKLHRILSCESKDSFPPLCGHISVSSNAFLETPYKNALKHRQERVIIVPQTKLAANVPSSGFNKVEKFSQKQSRMTRRLPVSSARILTAKVKRMSERSPAVDIYRDRRRRLRALKNLKLYQKNSFLSIEPIVCLLFYHSLDVQIRNKD